MVACTFLKYVAYLFAYFFVLTVITETLRENQIAFDNLLVQVFF